MRLIVTGHRDEKLATYDHHWIRSEIAFLVGKLVNKQGVRLAYSGMASGVDLWFCRACQVHQLPFIACVPFEEQPLTMDEEARHARETYLKSAVDILHVRNSWMVEHADIAIVVWDGNKGGTHNVLQQLIEKKIPFHWLNPVSQKIWACL